MSNNTNLNIFEKIISIFWQPTKTFKSINKNVSWKDMVIPLLLVVIVSWITLPYVSPISQEVAKEKFKNSQQYEELSEEQREQSLENIDNISGTIQYVTTIFSVALNAVILAIIMWAIGSFFLNGEVKFKKLFALAAYISLIGIIASAVKTPMIVSKGTTEIYTGAAALFEQSETFFFRLMKKIDIFAIWRVILFGFGLSVLYDSEKSKSMYLIFSLWLGWSVVISLIGGMSFM